MRCFLKRNLLVFFDVEGVIGLYSMQFTRKVKNLANKECRLLLSTLDKLSNATIYFCDCHNVGEYTINLIKEYPNVIFYSSLWDIDFNIKYDFSFFSGFHARNHSKGILSHSFRPEFDRIFIGDKECGEVDIFVNLLLYYNIPTIFISGCDMLMNESTQLNCVKNCSKTNESEDLNKHETYYYENYEYNLKKAINLMDDYIIENNLNQYDKSNISVSLTREEMFTFFEDNHSNKIIFKDTKKFIERLPEISENLNQYWKVIRQKLYTIKYRCIEIGNEKIALNIYLSDLLLKDINSFTLEDLDNILSILNDIK